MKVTSPIHFVRHTCVAIALVAAAGGCQFSLDRTLDPGDIRGQVVVQSVQGNVPVSGADVRLAGSVVHESTDSEGRFVIHDMGAGAYELSIVYAPAGVTSSIVTIPVTLAAGDGIDLGTIQLVLAGTVSGVVRLNDSSGPPVADAALTVVTSNGSPIEGIPSARSGGNGQYTLPFAVAGTNYVKAVYSTTTGGTMQFLSAISQPFTVTPRVQSTADVILINPVAASAGTVQAQASYTQPLTSVSATLTSPSTSSIAVSDVSPEAIIIPSVPAGIYTLTVNSKTLKPVVVQNVAVDGDTNVGTVIFTQVNDPNEDTDCNDNGILSCIPDSFSGCDTDDDSDGIPDAMEDPQCLCRPGGKLLPDGDCGPLDPCASAQCDPNATCTSPDGVDPICACNTGFSGDGLACLDDQECEDGTAHCDPNAVCTDSPGSFTCTCSPGFTGDGTTCTAETFTIGGTISGLAGTGLVIEDNGGDDISPTMNGTFVFPTALAAGSAYSVAIAVQPSQPTQACVVSSGASGSVAGANVTSIVVTCTTSTFTVGGTASGVAGSGLVLQDNSGDSLDISVDGTFAFPTAIASGEMYDVTVLTQPTTPNQTCTVANAMGTINSLNVTNVLVTCTTTTAFPINVTVSGLSSTGLVLQDNGADTLTVSMSGTATFMTELASGQSYSVTVEQQPTGETCTVATPSGNVGTSGVTVTVTCAKVPITIAPSSPTTVAGGMIDFTATGGSGSGYTWSLSTNNSKGSITPPGVYTAGTSVTGSSVTDIAVVTDSAENTASVNIVVARDLSISPTKTSTTVGGSISFSSGGGIGAQTWSVSGASGGTISQAGVYTAGSSTGTDTVQVKDANGDIATATVTVFPTLVISPTLSAVIVNSTVTFTATGGSGSSYTWSFPGDPFGSMLTTQGVFTAGNTTGASVVVQVTDSAGDAATITVAIDPPLQTTPSSAQTLTEGTVSFSASGGSGSGYRWSPLSAPSGGSISSSGAYQAGTTGNVTDVVEVVDSAGNMQTADVTVLYPLTLSAPTQTVPPNGTIQLSTIGGTGTGLSWTLTTNNSNGGVSNSGLYQAGSVGNVIDIVEVTDSGGNGDSIIITVTPGISIVPSEATTPPMGSVAFTASGGSNTGFTWKVEAAPSGPTASIIGSGSGGQNGAYTAGSIGGETDVVEVADSLGNTSSVSVAVTAGISISSVNQTVTPGTTIDFTASGGSGSYTWSFETDASVGSILSSGKYVAGSTTNVTDVVEVTDSLGNTATVDVTVNPPPYPLTISIDNSLAGSGLTVEDSQNVEQMFAPGSTGGLLDGTVPGGSTVTVTITAQPLSPSQTCSLNVSPTGKGQQSAISFTMTANATVYVTCVTNAFALGGIVSGYDGTSSFTIAVADQSVSIRADGLAAFPNGIPSGTSYTVTVVSVPQPGPTCTVSGGSGQIGNSSDLAAFTINCSPDIEQFQLVPSTITKQSIGDTVQALLQLSEAATGELSVTIGGQPFSCAQSGATTDYVCTWTVTGQEAPAGVVTMVPVTLSATNSADGTATQSANLTVDFRPILTIDGTQVQYIHSPGGNDTPETLGTLSVPTGKFYAIAGVDSVNTFSGAYTGPTGIGASAFVLDTGAADTLHVWTVAASGLTLVATITPTAGGTWPQTPISLSSDAPKLYVSGIDSSGDESKPVPMPTIEYVATPNVSGASMVAIRSQPGTVEPPSTISSKISGFAGNTQAGTAVLSEPMWMERQPGQGLPPRTYDAMAYDIGRDRIVRFGGVTAGGAYPQDVWEFDGYTWAQITPASGPAGRSGHSLVYDASLGRVILFGGSQGSTFYNDIWAWDGAAWTQLDSGGAVSAPAPSARQLMTACYEVTLGTIVVFGGQDASGDILQDTWLWNGSVWSSPTLASFPPARAHAVMAEDPGDGGCLLYGGSSGTGALTDTWLWTGTAWSSLPQASGPLPQSIDDSMIFDPLEMQIYLFGGNDGTGTTTEAWNFSQGQWSLNTDTFFGGTARQGASIIEDPIRQRFVLASGFDTSNPSSPFSDTWQFSSQDIWSKVTPSTSFPETRTGHSMVYDSNYGWTLMFGGQDPVSGTVLNDLWEWNGSNWTQLISQNGMSPPPRVHAAMVYDAFRFVTVLYGGEDGNGNPLTDVWEWDGTNWTNPSTSSGPSACCFIATANDSNAGMVVFFGGEILPSQTPTSELWTWDGSTWTSLSYSGSPDPRWGATLAADSDFQEIVLQGGFEPTRQGLADTWILTIDNDTATPTASWTEQISGGPPGPRFQAAACDYPGMEESLVFGGQSSVGTDQSSDLWAWSVDIENTWVDVSMLTTPAARYDAAMVLDSERNVAVLYGGVSNATPTGFPEIWELDLPSLAGPAIQFDADLNGENIDVGQVTNVIARAVCGGTVIGANTISGAFLSVWDTGLAGGPPNVGWAPVGSDGAGAQTTSPFDTDTSQVIVWSPSAADVATALQQSDARVSLQCVPAATSSGSASTVAATYMEVRFQYGPSPAEVAVVANE